MGVTTETVLFKFITAGTDKTTGHLKMMTKQFTRMEGPIKTVSKDFNLYNKRTGTMIGKTKEMTINFKRFRMELLSVMFGAMMLRRTLTQIMRVSITAFNKIAEASGITGTAIARLSVWWEYLKFTIGRAINEALMPLMPFLIRIISFFAQIIARNPTKVFWGLVAAMLILTALFMMATMGLFLDGLTNMIVLSKAGMVSLTGLIAVIAKIAFWALFFWLVWKAIGIAFPKTADNIMKGFKNIWEGIKQGSVEAIVGGLAQIVIGLLTVLARAAYTVTIGITKVFIAQVAKWIGDLAGVLGLGKLESNMRGFTEAVGESFYADQAKIQGWGDTVHNALQGWIDSHLEATGKSQELTDQTNDLSLATSNFADSTDIAAEMSGNFNSTLTDLVKYSTDATKQVALLSETIGEKKSLVPDMKLAAKIMREVLKPAIDLIVEAFNRMKAAADAAAAAARNAAGGGGGRRGRGTLGGKQFGGLVGATGLYRLHAGERVVRGAEFGNINITINTTGGMDGRQLWDELKREIERYTTTKTFF